MFDEKDNNIKNNEVVDIWGSISEKFAENESKDDEIIIIDDIDFDDIV